MWYLKNVPGWERSLRILSGLALAVAGFIMFKITIGFFVLAASGSAFVLTGLVGWCPMCAMVGRRPAERGK